MESLENVFIHPFQVDRIIGLSTAIEVPFEGQGDLLNAFAKGRELKYHFHLKDLQKQQT